MNYDKYILWMEELLTAGIVTETQVIHLKIRRDFDALRQTKTVSVCERLLAEKFYLSESSIHAIIYNNSSKNIRPKNLFDLKNAQKIF